MICILCPHIQRGYITVITPGWGKGGLATMWKKRLTKYMGKIKCDRCDIFRIQATKFPNAEFHTP